MKRLFFTTSIVALGTMSAGLAHGAHTQTQTLSTAEYVQVNRAVKVTSQAIGLHTGDFQVNTKSAKPNYLYRGEGASLMRTIILYRD